ncbi:MAG TPA: glycosyltransferase family 39 protein [Fulvivirga sp.]|nr:glycosyltransferase family 39 protein [Fulvivirga sp.]
MYQKVIYVGLCILILVYSISLIDRKIDVDDCMLGEHAYWMAKEGKVKTVLFWGNGLNWAQEQFHYHKLFILVGAIFIKIFGFSLTVLKSVSLVFTIAFSFILFKFLRSIYGRQRGLQLTTLSLLLLIINGQFFERSFMYRPEVMVMFIGFISFIFLDLYNQNQKKSYIILSGIMAGLAVFTHLNGLIFAFATVVILLFNLRIKDIIWFSIPFILTASLYFFNITNGAEFQQFIFQFTNDPNLAKKDFSIFEPFYKILNEHKRFFHSPKEAVFSILFVLSLIIGYKNYSSREKYLFHYLIFLIIGLAGLSHGVTAKYAIIYYPFMIILIAISIYSLIEKKRAFLWMNVLMVSYLLIQITSDLQLFKSKLDVEKRNNYIATQLKGGKSIFANEYLIFNEIEHFTIKSALPLAYEYGFKSKPLSYQQKRFFELAEKGHNDYIVVDTIYNNKFYDTMLEDRNLELGSEHYNYRLIHKQDGIYIFKFVDKKVRLISVDQPNTTTS